MPITVQLRAGRFLRSILAALILICFAEYSYAQSANIEFPTSVTTNEISGVIEARDVGDARLTRHFYLLTATPGDLILSVESVNLNGDVDVFTAGSLRPLTKLSIFAGISTTSSTKSVFLRQRASLILRVEARSANDDPGSYRIRFTGGFEPIADANPTSEETDTTTTVSRTRGKNVRRVNAVGARIKEPEPEPEPVASVKPPETVTATTTDETKTEVEPVKPAEPKLAKTKLPRPVRVPKNKPAARAVRKTPSVAVKKRDEPQPTSAPAPNPAPAPAEPALNPRLIIETRDGVRVERYMSEVRRVTVERGQLIVVTIDGRVERRPMVSVLRVTIEP